jgi:hypothetical protein
MRSFMALLLALACLSCGGSSVPVKTARDVSGSAYDAALLVWAWADGSTKSEYRAASDLAIVAVKNLEEELAAQCGGEIQECAESAYQSIMAKWADANDYLPRATRLNNARMALALWHAANEAESGDPRVAAREAMAVVRVILDDLEKRGAKVPREVLLAMTLVDAFLGKVPPGTIVSMARPLGAQ